MFTVSVVYLGFVGGVGCDGDCYRGDYGFVDCGFG